MCASCSPQKHLAVVAVHRYNVFVSQTNHTSSKRTAALNVLSTEDRVWLAERLVEYRKLLEYLHTN